MIMTLYLDFVLMKNPYDDTNQIEAAGPILQGFQHDLAESG